MEVDFKKIKQFFDKIDLSKRLPNYINKWIFRFFFFVIGMIVIYDIYNFGIVSYYVDCTHSDEPCSNPYYACKYIGNVADYSDYPPGCSWNVPDMACYNIPCDWSEIPAGAYYGRDDFLFKHGYNLIFFLWFLSFVFNHLYFMFKYKRLLPSWRKY